MQGRRGPYGFNVNVFQTRTGRARRGARRNCVERLARGRAPVSRAPPLPDSWGLPVRVKVFGTGVKRHTEDRGFMKDGDGGGENTPPSRDPTTNPLFPLIGQDGHHHYDL